MEIESCPKCGGEVYVNVHSGNAAGELSDYEAKCKNGDMHEKYFGSDGRKNTAIREYNKWAKEQSKVNA